MQDYDLLICPATIMPAYPVEERYPGYSDGLEYSEYYRWLAICCAVTTTTLPVITLPCGKTDTGLPVGLQLIGKAHGELELFALASYLEQVFGWDPLQAII
jgi:amidase